jgi:hypothetical protein
MKLRMECHGMYFGSHGCFAFVWFHIPRHLDGGLSNVCERSNHVNPPAELPYSGHDGGSVCSY